MSRNFSERMLLLVAVLLVTAVGCRPNDPITHVVVDSDRSGVKFGSPSVVEGRMLVGIHRAEKNTWTFKVVGPVEQVDEVESQVIEFFRIVSISRDSPVLTELPKGWSKVPGGPSQFIYAKVKINDELTMSISELPARFNNLENVNRWRKQLSLPPTDSADLKPLPGDSKISIEVFDANGLVSSGGMTPPFAGMSSGAGMSNGADKQPPDSPILFDAPEGWTAGDVNSMVSARFRKEDGDLKAQITVVIMPPIPLNEWSQVSRNWAAEVGIQALSDEELIQKTKEMTVDSIRGKLIRLIDDESDSLQGLIGIRLERDNDVWFIKLKGDKSLVADSEEAFEKFAKSVRFK